MCSPWYIPLSSFLCCTIRFPSLNLRCCRNLILCLRLLDPTVAFHVDVVQDLPRTSPDENLCKFSSHRLRILGCRNFLLDRVLDVFLSVERRHTSGQLENIALQLAVHPNRNAASTLQDPEASPFRKASELCRSMGELLAEFEGFLVVAADFDAQGALGNGMEQSWGLQIDGHSNTIPQSDEACLRKDQGSIGTVSCIQLCQASVSRKPCQKTPGRIAREYKTYRFPLFRDPEWSLRDGVLK